MKTIHALGALAACALFMAPARPAAATPTGAGSGATAGTTASGTGSTTTTGSAGATTGTGGSTTTGTGGTGTGGAGTTTGAPACFTSADVPNWTAHDVGASVGASMPAGTSALLLCGDGAGYGPDDALRTVTQEVDGDFEISALVALVDEGNEGGLEARTIVRVPDAPRVRITVSRAAGSVWLSAEARDGGTLVAATPVPVSLPVSVRLARTGSIFEAAWSSGGAYLPLLTHDATGTELAATSLAVSAAQGAPFGAPGEVELAQLALVDDALPPDLACTAATVTPSGTSLIIDGDHLAQISTVRVAGEFAQVLAQSDSRLVLEAPRPANAFASGAIVVESPDHAIAAGRVAYAGAPFIRGDVDENGVVDADDVSALAARLGGTGDVDCVAAADVDADGDVDAMDLSRLDRFVRTGRKAPAAPFPAPGYSAFPAPACGLGTAPTVASITDGNGRPLSSRTPLTTGAEVVMNGANLPTSDDVAFYFGDVPVTRLPGSTSTAVRLRVGAVPSSGTKCPRLFESTDIDASPASRFGLVREVRADTLAQHVCPDFAASSGVLASFSWNASTREAFLPVPASAVDPAAGAQVDLLLVRPAITGSEDRGSRRVSVFGRATDSAMSYASLLEDLARRLSRQLDGGAPLDGCRPSDYVAIADPFAGGIFVRPTTTSPGGLPPAPPPHTTQVAPMKPPLDGGAAGGISLAKPSCGDANIDPRSRLGAWCAFIEATTTQNNGLPAWEDSVPQSALYASANEIANLPHPNDRSVGDKRTMYNFDTHEDLRANDYLDACAIAARAAYCEFNGTRDWMPAFRPSAQVYKGFWRTWEDLPASADPNDLYSYDPPNGPRQYLVGLHVAYGTGAQIEYWNWATFWFPDGNDLLTKGGGLLLFEYNPTCKTGSLANQPQEVTGVWKNYLMCIDTENDGAPCGNPWGPQDECKAEGCRSCHLNATIDMPPGATPTGETSTAWMGTWTRAADVLACYDEIQTGLDNDQEPYVQLTPDECN